MPDLGSIAHALPGVDEGRACAGTSQESRSFRVKGKAFLFVSADVARFKLSASAAEARRLGCEVGAQGWVKLALDAAPSAAVLRRWITESHALLAGGTAASKPRARTAPRRRSKR